jgi:hypothetical protein
MGFIIYFLIIIVFLDHAHVSKLEKYLCFFSQMVVILISLIDIGLTFQIVIIVTFVSPWLQYLYILTHKKGKKLWALT